MLKERTQAFAASATRALIPELSLAGSDDAEIKRIANAKQQLIALIAGLGGKSTTVFTEIGNQAKGSVSTVNALNGEFNNAIKVVGDLAAKYAAGTISFDSFKTGLEAQQTDLTRSASGLSNQINLLQHLQECVKEDSDEFKLFGNAFKLITDAVEKCSSATSGFTHVLQLAGELETQRAGATNATAYQDYARTVELAKKALVDLAAAQKIVSEYNPRTASTDQEAAFKAAKKTLADLQNQLEQYKAKLESIDTAKISNSSLEIDALKKTLNQLIDESKKPDFSIMGAKLAESFSAAHAELVSLENGMKTFPIKAENMVEAIDRGIAKATGNIDKAITASIKEQLVALANSSQFTIPPLKAQNFEAIDGAAQTAFNRIHALVGGLSSQWESFVQLVETKAANPKDTKFKELHNNLDVLRGITIQLGEAFNKVANKPTEFGREFNSTSQQAISNLSSMERLLSILGPAFSSAGAGQNAFAMAMGSTTKASSETLKSIDSLRISLIETAAAKTQISSISESVNTVGSSVINLRARVHQLGTELSQLKPGDKAGPISSGFEKIQNDADATAKKLTQYRSVLDNILKVDDTRKVFSAEVRNQILDLINQIDHFRSETDKSIHTLNTLSKTKIDVNIDAAAEQFKKLESAATAAAARISSAFGGTQVTKEIDETISKFLANLKGEGNYKSIDTLITQLNELKKAATDSLANTSEDLNSRLKKTEGVQAASDSIQVLIKSLKDYYNESLNTLRLSAIEKEAFAAKGDVTKKERDNAARSAEALRAEIGVIEEVISELDKYSASLNKAAEENKNLARQMRLLDEVAKINAKISENAAKNTDLTPTDSVDAYVRKNKELNDAIERTIATADRLAKKLRESDKNDEANALEALIQNQRSLQQAINENVQSYQQLQTVLDQVVRKSNVGKASFDEWIKSLSDVDSSTETIAHTTDLFSEGLKKLRTDFVALLSGVNSFSESQTVYEGHKSKVNELSRSVLALIQVLQLMGKDTDIDFGNGIKVKAGELVQSLQGASKEITGEAAQIRAALQAGGSTLDDYLPKGNRLKQATDDLQALKKEVGEFRSSLIRANPLSVSTEDLTALKTSVTDIDKHRADLLKDLQSNLDRLKSVQKEFGGQLSPALQTDLQEAINRYESLIGEATIFGTLLKKQFSELKVNAEPFIQLRNVLKEVTDKMEGLKAASAGTFNQNLNDLLAKLQSQKGQFGLQTTELEKTPKPALLQFMDDLNLRIQEVRSSSKSLAAAISEAETAQKNGKIVDVAELNNARIKLGEVKAELDGLRSSQETLSRLIKSTAITAFEDLGKAATISVGEVSRAFNLVSSQGINAVNAALTQFLNNVKQLNTVGDSVTTLSHLEGLLGGLHTQLLDAAKGSATFEEAVTKLKGFGGAADSIQTLIKLVHDYYSESLTQVRAQQLLAQGDKALYDELEKTAQGYQAAILTLDGYSKKIADTVETTNTLIKTTEKLDNLPKDIKAPAATSTTSTDILQQVKAFGELEAEVKRNISQFDKWIEKLQEMKASGAAFSLTGLEVSLNGVKQTITSLDDYIKYLQDASAAQKKQSQDAANSVSVYTQLVDILEKVTQGNKLGATSFEEWITAIQASNTGLNHAGNILLIFKESLAQIRDGFTASTSSAVNFTEMLDALKNKKGDLSGLYQSIQEILRVFETLKAANINSIDIGGGTVYVQNIISLLKDASRQITGDMTQIRNAMKVGSEGLNDWLSGQSKLSDLGERIKLVKDEVLSANTEIGKLQAGTVNVTQENVEAVKGTISKVVSERSAIIKEIDSGLKKLQDAQSNMIAGTGAKSTALSAEITDAINKLQALKVEMEEASTGSGFTKNFDGLKVEPFLQLLNLLKEIEEKAKSVESASGNTVNATMNKLLVDLHDQKSKFGLQTEELERTPKADLLIYMDNLRLRTQDVQTAYKSLTQAIIEAESAKDAGGIVNVQDLVRAKDTLLILETQLKSLRLAQEDLGNLIKSSSVSAFADLGKAAKDAIGEVSNSFNLANFAGMKNVNVALMEFLKNISNLETVNQGNKNLQYLKDSLVGLSTQLENAAKSSTTFEDAVTQLNGVKTAATSVESLIKVLRDYYTESLLSVRSSQLQADQGSSLYVELENKAKGFTYLISILEGYSKEINKVVEDTNELIKTNEKLDKLPIKINPIVSVDPTGVADILAKTAAFKDLEAEVKRNVSQFDKYIEKLQEMKSSGQSFGLDSFKVTDSNGIERTITSLDEYIKYFQDASAVQKRQVQDTINSVSSYTKLTDALDKVAQSTKNGITSVEEYNRHLKDSDSGVSGARTLYDLLMTSLTEVKGEFVTSANSATSFLDVLDSFKNKKSGLNEIYNSMRNLLQVFQEMSASGIKGFNFFGDNLKIEGIIKSVRDQLRAISAEIVQTNAALKSGGVDLNDWLEGQSKLGGLEEKIEKVKTAVASANATIAGLKTNVQQATESDVEKVKEQVATIVKERKEIAKELDDGIKKLQTAQTGLLLGKEDGTVISTELNEQINSAIKKLNELKTAMETTESGGSLGKGIKDSIDPILQLADAMAKATTQMNLGSDSNTLFGSSLQHINTLLKESQENLGRTRTTLEEKPKEELKGYMDTLNLRVRELMKSFNELHQVVNLAQGANPSLINPESIEAAKIQLVALRAELERTRAAQTQLKEVMDRSINSSGLMAAFPNIAHNIHEVRDAGALLSKGLMSVFELVAKQNISRLGDGADAARARMRELATEMRKLEDVVVSSLRTMDQWSMGLQMAGQSMMQPFKEAVSSFVKFEDSLAIVKGILNVTSSQMEELTNKTIMLGMTTRHSAGEAADAVKQLAYAGYTTAQQMQLLPTVMNLATAAELNLSEATKIAMQVMSSQRLPIDQVAHGVDILALAANRTTATLAEVGEGFKYIGALSGTVGNKIEDTASAIALLHNAGMRGSMAGTALRGSMQALLNPTTQEAAVLKQVSDRLGGLGLQILDSSGKFVGYQRIIEQFEKAGVNTSEILEMFGQRAGPGMAALLQMGSAKLRDLKDDLENADGVTAHIAQTLEETLGGRLQIMANNFAAFGESVGRNLSGSLGFLADAATFIVRRFMVMREQLGPLTVILDNFAALVASVVLGLGTLAIAFTMSMVPVGQFMSFLKTVGVLLFKGSSALVLYAVEMGTVAKTSAAAMGAAAASVAMRTTEAAMTTETAAVRMASSWKAAAGAAGGFHGVLQIIIAAGRALFLTPIGLLITGLTVAVGLWFAFAKNTTVANEELDKQRDMLINTGKEYDSLGTRIIKVGEVMQSLRVGHIGLDESKFMDLGSVEEQKQKLMGLMQTFIDRIKEGSDQFKKAFAVDVVLNKTTGELEGFKLISTETGGVLGELSTEMLKNANAAEVMSGEVHKLNSALQEVENKEIENISQEKMKNIVKTFHSFLTDHVQEAYPLESLEKQYNELVKKKSDYYKKLSELDKKKASTDSNFRRASIELEKEYIAAEIAGLNSEIESVGKYKEQALKSEKFLEGGIKQLIVEAIKELNTKKLPITVDNILLEIKPILKMSGMSDSTIENFFDKRIRGIYEAMQKASSSAANDLDLTAGLEKAFRGMQNYVDSMAKLLDKQIKDLKTNMDDNKKLLDVYDQIAKQYTKVRQTIVAAYQTEYKGESAEIARQLEVDLNQIQEVGMRTYTGLGNNSIAYMQKSKDSDRMGFESFAEFQGKKIDVSKYTNEQMYSLFKNSLTKQIDDLERKDKVTENVYSIPVRLQVEQGFGMKTINTFVADAKRSTGELLTYTKTFDNELVQAHLDMETRKLDLTLNANKKEEENLNKLYKEKIFPLYKVGTEDRLKVEEEYTTKKIALEEKGYKATEKTIQEIYKQHKQLDDKLHQLDSDRANFHNKIDQDRRKLEDSQLNDVQKLEDSKRRIRNLTEQAGLAANEGNLDRSKALYEKALAEMDKMKVEPFDQDSMNFQKRYFEQLETGYDSVADRMKSAGESEKKLLLDTAVKLEDTLASFDANLKELAKTLKSLAEAMTALTKSDAKLGGVDVDNADALHKINAITEAMRQARLEFEKPMRIEVSEKEALEEIGKLGKEYADSNKQYQQAERTKAAASKIKQEYDEAEKLLAVYHALKETVTALTIPDTKGKVVAGEMLEGVDKKDSDAAKKYAEINEYIKQRLELIKNLEVAYQQAGKEVPKEIQQRKELLELAKQQMTPDSKGNVLVTQDIDKALKGVIAGTDEYKSLMLDTLQKERLLRERIKRVTIEQAQAIADLNKEIQKNKDQGADPNIARQSVTNPSQGVGELRNQLENLKKLLKDFPELQSAYDAVKKAIDSATEGYKSQTEEIEKNTDAVKKNAEASKASENTTSTKKESVQQQANEFAAGWKAEADAINEKQKIVEQEKQQEKDHEDYLRSRAAGMTEDQKLNDQQKQQEENLLTFMQDTANQKQQLADSQKSANAQSAQNAQKLDGYKQRIEALQAERAEIEKNIAADQKREAQDKVAGTYDKTRSFGYDLADQGKLAQNTAELEKLKADMQDYLAASQAAAANSPELQVKTDTSQVQEGISWIEKVLGYNGKTVEVQVLMKAMLDNNGTNRGFQLGGLIQHFAEGGLAQIQRLASGGQSLFRRITNMVPGVGKGDTVPAMLEPGEYVIRGDAVKKYGVNFLELVNRGMLQFKALGGSMMELPSLAASSLSGLIMPNFNMPSEGALAGGHGDMMTINWQIGNKTFPVKSARSQVSDMVNAIKQLDRGY